MKREELIVGQVYVDQDHIRGGVYEGGYGAGTLSKFREIEWREDGDGFDVTDGIVVLTETELKHWEKLGE